MSKRAVGVLGLVLVAGGLVVALVQAQESSRRSAGASTPSPASSRYSLSDAPAQPAQPVRAPGSLAERMRQWRAGSGEAPVTAPSAKPIPLGNLAPTQPPARYGQAMQPTPQPAYPPADDGQTFNAAPLRTATLPSPQATINSTPQPLSPVAQPTVAPVGPSSPLREASGFPLSSPADGTSAPARERPLRSVLKRNEAGELTGGQATPRMAQNPGYEPWSSRRAATSNSGGPAAPVVRQAAPLTASTAPLRKPVADALALRSEAPPLKVETHGPRAVVIGRPASYTVSITNGGGVPATGVAASVALPSWVEVAGGDASSGDTQHAVATGGGAALVWNLKSVAAGGREQLRLQLIARESQPFELGVSWQVTPAPDSARIQVQEPQLQLALLGPDDVLFGETNIYTIAISNPGTGDAENVALRVGSLSPNGADSPVQQIGTIAAGAQREIEIEVNARQSGQLQIDVEAVAEGGLRNQTSKQVRVRRAELAMQVIGPPLKYAGSIANYQVTITNSGDATADNVSAEAVIPVGAKYIGGIEQAHLQGNRLLWTIGQLPPGNERSFAIQCDMTAAGELRFDVAAQGDGNLSVADSVATRVEAIADVKLLVNDPQGPMPTDSNVEYELLLVNRGTKAAREIKAVMQFSEGIEPVAAAGHQAEVVPGQVLFATIEELGPGQQMTLRVTARSSQAGNHIYRAAVTSTDPEIRRVAEGTTRFFEAK